jgi:glycosyl hydrolase family 39 (putative alpha-L-iduronidase)
MLQVIAAASAHAAVAVAVSPGSASVIVNATQQFTATVTGTTTTGVQWFVDGVSGGNSTVGTVTTSGLYSAPAAAGTHSVKATSVADPTVSASVSATVFDSVSVDFGSRADTTWPIPPQLFGAALGYLPNWSSAGLLTQAGMTGVRVFANIQGVYATQTPDWTKIDPIITSIKNAGMRPILQLVFTPSWLQPSPNPCSGVTDLYRAPPADMTAWGNIAASYVTHMNATFPGLIQDYEIWDDPDLPNFLCVSDNTDATRRSTYFSIYAAAGPAMRAAAGNSIVRIGGPLISATDVRASTWIQPFVTNASLAPYIDFVAYHNYFGYNQHLTWDSGTDNVYSRTQGSARGAISIYNKVAGYVKAGLQPNAASTPIYISDYNMVSDGSVDCCRNSPTYSPVWNAMYVGDLLNTVYQGAGHVPGQLNYYAISNQYVGVCLLGTIDAAMDCLYPTSGSPSPYPQLTTYKLLAAPQYLGLVSGGYNAKSVSPAVKQAGIVVAGFYNANQDSAFLVNPTGTAFSQVPVKLLNPGYANATGTSYLLDSSHQNISPQNLSLASSGGGFTTNVDLPAYSVVGIALVPAASSVAISVAPTGVSVAAGATQQFTATVTGASDTSVSWWVDGVNGGNSTVGTISAGGLYTAPAAAGSHAVTAKSNADSTKAASAAVTVTVVAVSIAPTTASVMASATRQFTAMVTGTSNTGVTWSVDGVNGGNSTVGTISASGLYTAPASAGTHTVTATSTANPSKTASASVTVSTGGGVSVSISPGSASVQVNATTQFTATVTGAKNSKVNWSVDGVAGGNGTVGTISGSGLYTAPSTNGLHTIKATSRSDTTKFATASATVTGAVVSVSVSPSPASLTVNTTLQFTANVTGTPNTAVTWFVDGVIGGNTTVGTISASGLYTAPASTGSHTVKATSQADPTKSASSAVTVTMAVVSVSVSPSPASLAINTALQFTATVTGTSNTAVTWSVDGVNGGNTTVGTISTGGLYTAPATTGSHTVRATSQADPTKSGTSAVTVIDAGSSTVSADFGNHSSTAFPISPGIFGAQYSNVMPSAPMNTLYSGGGRTLRMYAWMQTVYASQTPNWTKLDQYLGPIKTLNVGKNPGFKVILEITYTPPWLVPTVSGCVPPGDPNAYRIPPNDVTKWAQLARSIVAYVDQNYPGLVTDYEIWNEPELGSFCVNPNDSTTRYNKYVSIYAAAAPQIRAQLNQDGQTARIGGPTIVNTGSISQWIGGLINDSSTAPYVDFVSYHKYPSGQSDITGCMQWDTYAKWDSATSTCVPSSSGVTPLYSRVQSTSTTGFAAHYLSVANTVKAGKQPNPLGTKIYLDEYNDNWYFYAAPPAAQDCCRNSPTYSPVFNGLVMVDMLDTIYQGAHRVPDSLEYYSLSNQPFCLFGDTTGNCGISNFNTSYPQFYLYSLFASPNYLNLSGGGSYMAANVTPKATSSGLAATAFWSANQDSIVIVNPTSISYGSVLVTASNPGFTVGHVTKFLLNDTNKTITSSTLAASASVTVSVPPYSVVAIKMTP